MCKVLNVSRSCYYKWRDRSKSPRQERREELAIKIRQVFIESRQLYGSPKITKILNQKGFKVTQKTVGRIMKENGMRSTTIKKYKATTNSKHSLPVHENTLNQKFKVTKPNEVWAADITMTKELVLKALRQAYQRQQPPNSVLHHSDRGSQYAQKTINLVYWSKTLNVA